MKYLLIPALCVLASAKITLQSYFAKKNEQTNNARLTFNLWMFAAVALLCLPALFSGEIPPFVWVAAILFGILSAVFQTLYLKAFSLGDVSLTVLINNYSMMLPILVSVLFYHEPLGWVRPLGILLCFLSLAFDVSFTRGKRTDGKWLFCVLFVFLSNGAIGVLQKVFAAEGYGAYTADFLAIGYLTAAAFCAVSLLPARKKSPFRLTGKTLLPPLAVGAILTGFQYLYTYSLGVLPGTLLIPCYGGGVSVLLSITGVLLYKERLTKRKAMGLALGICAIVLMSF